jgi:4-hydroxybenzoate polyprenyltransferase
LRNISKTLIIKVMIQKLYQIVRTARPRQWLKNLSIFAAPIFAGRLFMGDTFPLAFKAFLVFCAMSSGAYFLNDIVDAPRDRLHPIKKNRPIASGKLGMPLAIVVCLALIAGSIIYSFMYLDDYFSMILVFYIILQLSYSFHFRNVIILDSLIVASGFVIRVFAGGFASKTSVSSWLALTTIGISMLLAFGKRRSEKTILAKLMGSVKDGETRKTLRHYPDALLDSMISMSAAYTILSYSLFSFMISPSRVSTKISAFLPSVMKSPKLMMLTIPVVIYGIARYLYVIYEKEEGESPERALLTDKPLLASVILWGVITMAVIFFLPELG